MRIVLCLCVLLSVPLTSHAAPFVWSQVLPMFDVPPDGGAPSWSVPGIVDRGDPVSPPSFVPPPVAEAVDHDDPAVVPEPGTLVLLGSGLALTARRLRRRSSRA